LDEDKPVQGVFQFHLIDRGEHDACHPSDLFALQVEEGFEDRQIHDDDDGEEDEEADEDDDRVDRHGRPALVLQAVDLTDLDGRCFEDLRGVSPHDQSFVQADDDPVDDRGFHPGCEVDKDFLDCDVPGELGAHFFDFS